MPFLLPTTVCDSEHPRIMALARELIRPHHTVQEAAHLIRAWIRSNIQYCLDDKTRKASETLRKGEGMCTNKANLQIALLRAAGVPAGYSLVHIAKDSFQWEHMPQKLWKRISDPTIHCFASVFIAGKFLHFDATERTRLLGEPLAFLEEQPDGQTQYQTRWLRGPFGPVQSSIDHLLLQPPGRGAEKFSAEDFEKINCLYRKFKPV